MNSYTNETQIDKKQSFFTKVFFSFSYTEKLIFLLISLVFLFTGLTLLLQYNESILEVVPVQGGLIEEGVIGTPRFVNPVIAVSDTDNDLVSLIYSGLMRIDEQGNLINDLAESYTVSEDGLTYTFLLKKDVTFHDNTPVTATDIVFTIDKIKTDIIKSPQRGNWDSIEVYANNEHEVEFSLPNPFPAFLLNTTLGILPSHIWQGVSDEEFPFTERNINPVGTGPYMVKKINKNSAGIAESYTLEAFNKFSLGSPYIEEVIIQFYKSELLLLEAIQNKEISSAGGISPQNAEGLEKSNHVITQFSLPRVFGVFYNQNQSPVLASLNVRRALEFATNKTEIVETVFNKYGQATNSPIPVALLTQEKLSNSSSSDTSIDTFSTEEALRLFTEAGFDYTADAILEDGDGQPLSITLATADVPELVQVARLLEKQWKDVGIAVTVDIFSTRDFTQNIIRSRSYDAILFGEVIGRDVDLYPFWHSSQRNDPGLNIANYANIDADAALEEARLLQESELKTEALQIITREIEQDAPALFLYNPDYIYVVPEELRGITPQTIMNGSDRFTTIHKWYKDTDRVWNFFNK